MWMAFLITVLFTPDTKLTSLSPIFTGVNISFRFSIAVPVERLAASIKVSLVSFLNRWIDWVKYSTLFKEIANFWSLGNHFDISRKAVSNSDLVQGAMI